MKNTKVEQKIFPIIGFFSRQLAEIIKNGSLPPLKNKIISKNLIHTKALGFWFFSIHGGSFQKNF